MIMIRFVARTYPPCWVLKARIQKHRDKPLLFHDKCPGFFYVHYTTHNTQHPGPTALRPIRRTKQLWLSVLLKDTSAAIGQAAIRTHILATPELESNALDRSARLFQNKEKYDTWKEVDHRIKCSSQHFRFVYKILFLIIQATVLWWYEFHTFVHTQTVKWRATKCPKLKAELHLTASGQRCARSY